MLSFVTSSNLIIFLLCHFIVTFLLCHYIVTFYCVIILCTFSLNRSLIFPYTCICIKSIDCILLSSFEIKLILLISLVKSLCLSLLILCSVFNINLLFFMNYLWPFLRHPILFFSRCFILFSIWELPLSSFYNLQI